jgi:hypothetical protein
MLVTGNEKANEKGSLIYSSGVRDQFNSNPVYIRYASNDGLVISVAAIKNNFRSSERDCIKSLCCECRK